MPDTPHHHFDTVGSTFIEAWAMVERGQRTPFWVTANRQTAGRGRLDRPWVSEPGNLYSTYVGAPPKPAALPLLPFMLSLAVRRAIVTHLPLHRQADAELKWPNDVLIGGAKISGVRVEQKTQPGRPSLMAIGIGVNVEHAPQSLERAVTSLAAEGSTATAGDVFQSLRHAVADGLVDLDANPGDVLAQWSRYAIGLGETVTVDVGRERVSGTFDHLAADGSLMLRLPSGALRALHAGDLVISSPSAPR